MSQADPTLALQSIDDQLVRTTLSALRTGVGYKVRTEVVGEKGSGGMIGLDVGLMRKTAPGVLGRRITPSFKERFGRATTITSPPGSQNASRARMTRGGSPSNSKGHLAFEHVSESRA